MRCDKVILVALLGLVAIGSAFASDPKPAANAQTNLVVDSKMILPAAERERFTAGAEDHTCLMLRTYRVRKGTDRDSVISTAPDHSSFDPDDIVGYSICQKAGKFAVKTTQ